MDFGNVKGSACLNVPIRFLSVQGSKRQKQQNMKPDGNNEGFWDIFANHNFHFCSVRLLLLCFSFLQSRW